MSWSEHLSKRLAASKNSINSTWSKFVRNKHVAHSAKYKVHDAATKSIMHYCAQVWGYKEYDQIEKLQRFFVKRCFGLPDNTPNYAIHIETGLPKAFLTTLKVHLAYIRKVMSMPRNRLPRILSEIMIQNNFYWAQEWSGLFQEIQIDFSFEAPCSEWNRMHKMLLTKLSEKTWVDSTGKALQSQYHDEYCNLLYSEVPNYFEDNNPRDMINLIFKARCGLLNLNARAFRNDTVGICTICNMDATENTYHFVGVCPIFKGYRKKYLGSEMLDRSTFLNFLNGLNYKNLYNYLNKSLKYRSLIIN